MPNELVTPRRLGTLIFAFMGLRIFHRVRGRGTLDTLHSISASRGFSEKQKNVGKVVEKSLPKYLDKFSLRSILRSPQVSKSYFFQLKKFVLKNLPPNFDTMIAIRRPKKQLIALNHIHTCSMHWGVLSLNGNSGKAWWSTVLLSIAPDCPCCNVIYDGEFLWWNDLKLMKIGKNPLWSRGLQDLQDLGHFLEMLVW